MTDRELEQQLGEWYASEIPAREAAPQGLRLALAEIPGATPRSRPIAGRWVVLLAAAALALSLLAAGIAIGMQLVKVPSFVPPPSAPAIENSEPPSPEATPTATRDVVAYPVPTHLPESVCSPAGTLRCRTVQIWIADADGSNARALLPEWYDTQELVGWSGDGKDLYFFSSSREGEPFATGLYVTNADARAPRRIEMGPLCRDYCNNLSISPDGTQIALAQWSESGSVIATVDVASGEIRELEATRAGAHPESVSPPRWSRDGETLAFIRSDAPNPERCFHPDAGAIMTVRADGTDLREIVPLERCAYGMRWSPDGMALTFYSDDHFLTEEPDGLYSHELHDVFVVNADGSDLRQLTTDRMSSQSSWTTDGRIVFARIPLDDGSTIGLNTPIGYEVWIMEADGSNPRELDAFDLGSLSAVGCLTCPYAVRDQDTFVTRIALWQPEP